jgi:hypothetical protein
MIAFTHNSVVNAVLPDGCLRLFLGSIIGLKMLAVAY